MNKFETSTIDDIEFPIYKIYWTIDSTNAYRIRPFVDLKDGNIGYLDDLSQSKKPQAERVFSTDIILEALYRLTSSDKQRMLLLDYDTRITTEFKLFRREMLEMVEIYEKFSKRFAVHQEIQSKLFDIKSIDKRLDLLLKTSFESDSVLWHVQPDNSSVVRPFLKLNNNKAGYLDTCEIANMPNKDNVFKSHELGELIMSFLSANQKQEKTICILYESLATPARLSQKTIARICQVYHETADKYANNQVVISEAFSKKEA